MIPAVSNSPFIVEAGDEGMTGGDPCGRLSCAAIIHDFEQTFNLASTATLAVAFPALQSFTTSAPALFQRLRFFDDVAGGAEAL
jgi:hypothetical protein